MDGKPGIRFPAEVISSGADFKFALVGTISGNRSLVPNSAINVSIAKMGLCRSFDLKFLPGAFLSSHFLVKGIMLVFGQRVLCR